LSFDLTDAVTNLPTWLSDLQEGFAEASSKNPEALQPLKILLEPTQQMIGSQVYEVAFIADSDGLPLEFLRVLSTQ
jgi:hypothetical protein